jgi:hypothetical protein
MDPHRSAIDGSNPSQALQLCSTTDGSRCLEHNSFQTGFGQFARGSQAAEPGDRSMTHKKFPIRLRKSPAHFQALAMNKGSLIRLVYKPNDPIDEGM